MRLRTSVALALCLLAKGEPAWASGALERYLASAQAAGESPAVRAALETLVTGIHEIESAENARLCAAGLSLELRELEAALTTAGRQALRSQFAALLARPALDTFYDAPGAPFRVHYSLTGPDAVLGGTTDTLPDGRPRYVHTAAEALVRAWEALIDTLGYPVPLSDSALGGGLHLYDCYLAQTGFSNVIGFTAAEFWYGKPIPGDTLRIATSYQVIHPTMAPFPQVSDPLDLLRITCAHEFFHAIHFTYDLDEKPDWQATGFWLEGTSVWFEDFAFPDVNDWSNLPYYLNAPERSLTDSPNLSDIHPYGGGSMWAFYLVERYGGPGILRDIWERCGLDSADNTLAATDSVLQTRGSSLNGAWHEFASWCMRTGSRWESGSFSQGASWAQVQPTVTLFNYPSAVHFTDGTDNLQSNLDPSVPVTTIGPSATPVASLGFSASAHIPFPTNRPDSGMSFFVQSGAGLPAEFQYVAKDTSVNSVEQGALVRGDTTLVSGWLAFDTLFVVASAGLHYAPGDTVGDPLADVTPLLSAALDSAGPLTQLVQFEEPFPNPFVPAQGTGTQFVVVLPEAATVMLDIFNVAGDAIRNLQVSASEWPPASLLWDGRNANGAEVASGLYLCKLTVQLTASGAREEKLFRVGVVR